MRKRIAFTTAVLVVVALALPASAADRLDSAHQLQPKACSAQGAPVINVTQRVTNDADSGQGGNYWAIDTYLRRIQVWQTADGFCAVVRYSGRFDALEGEASPGNAGTLEGDEDGTFQGGYRAYITGSLRAEPDWPTRGTVGRFDYGCNSSGTCSNRVNWLEKYFEDGWSFEYGWWGWIYRAGRHGTWINSSDGNSGDIT